MKRNTCIFTNEIQGIKCEFLMNLDGNISILFLLFKNLIDKDSY